jgi:hypothetical protein
MQAMARRMWLPMFAMGAMVLMAALGIGAAQSIMSSDFHEVDRATREAATASGSLLDKQQFVETTSIWLPRFQLLGMGLLFSGITFLLATILGNLRLYGGLVQERSGRKVLALKPPWSAQLFPMLMMMGLMVLIGAFVTSIVVATIANDVFDKPLALLAAAEPTPLAEIVRRAGAGAFGDRAGALHHRPGAGLPARPGRRAGSGRRVAGVLRRPIGRRPLPIGQRAPAARLPQNHSDV